MPAYLSRIAGPITDRLSVTLRIACLSPDELEIVDKTPFGRNATRVTLDGVEHEKASRNGRKRFMLSGSTTDGGQTSVIRCRLHERGEGWETRQHRFKSAENPCVLVEQNRNSNRARGVRARQTFSCRALARRVPRASSALIGRPRTGILGRNAVTPGAPQEKMF